MKHLIALVTAGLIFASCSSDLEKRVADLERRIATLENGNSAINSTTNSNQLVKSVSNSASPSISSASTDDANLSIASGPVPSFEFSEESFDFGNIKEGDEVSHTFSFTNVGEAPLIIESAKGSCGCTVPNWPKNPIPVGGTGDIEVKFNSKGKPGQQNKTVTITANTNPTITRLTIKANVEKAEQVSASAAGPVKN